VTLSGNPQAFVGLPGDVLTAEATIQRNVVIPGWRVPQTVPWEVWLTPRLRELAVPLPEANTLAHANYLDGKLACLEKPGGERCFFNPEVLLVKFVGSPLLSVVRVAAGLELKAMSAIATRGDVEFVQPDILERRCFQPDDVLATNQWHLDKIGSFAAWDYGDGSSPVRVAIVDTPFQMDHPDLVANTVAGWDAVANQPVSSGVGIDHSTMAAGLIAAGLNNGFGVAGLANCKVLPVNTTGFESELCNAVYWAASNGVRVVNISWTGAGSDALNAAGNYLKIQARGVLVMSGENGAGEMTIPNQPDIWVVAMTDAADNQRCKYGVANDFAAPGWAVYSTLAGGQYGYATGTSYAAPVLAGVVAKLFTINPALSPDDVRDILISTARDLGDPGWDMWFGSGRIDFGAAAALAYSRLPRLSILSCTNNQICIATGVKPGVACQLWRSPVADNFHWTLVTNAQFSTNSDELIISVSISPNEGDFFRISVEQ
jgi:subtilisin family serine protease